MPPEGYSEAARNFVRGCLNKIPNLRPTYAMLLQHVWLAELIKPETITEEDEDEVVAAADGEVGAAAGDVAPPTPVDDVVDKEVAEWVKGAIRRRKEGTMKRAEKPALHAAPLDKVGTTNGLDAATPVETTA